jgi:hypothetical protein
MAKNAEMEIGIFIKGRPFDLSMWAEMLGYKLWISAGFFGVMADQLTTGRARIFKQRYPAVSRELVECIGHGQTPRSPKLQ